MPSPSGGASGQYHTLAQDETPKTRTSMDTTRMVLTLLVRSSCICRFRSYSSSDRMSARFSFTCPPCSSSPSSPPTRLTHVFLFFLAFLTCAAALACCFALAYWFRAMKGRMTRSGPTVLQNQTMVNGIVPNPRQAGLA